MNQEAAAKLARLQAGHAAKFAWSDEQIAAVRRLAEQGINPTQIARTAGVGIKTLLARAPKLGIDLHGKARRLRTAADELLCRLYPTAMPIGQVLDAWNAACGRKRSGAAMRAIAEAMGLRRGAAAAAAAAKVIADANSARYAALRVERARNVQVLVDAGASKNALAAGGLNKETLRKMVAEGLVVFPPKPAPTPKPVVVKAPKPPKPPRAPSPPKPRKPRVWVYSAPAAPKPRAQTVEEWLANGGEIKRLPTAAVCATQATIPAADVEALRAYRAANQDSGNWMQQRRAWVARNKGTGVMAP